MKLDHSAVLTSGFADRKAGRSRPAPSKPLVAAGTMLEFLNAHLGVIEAQCMDEMALTITGIRGLGPTEQKVFGRNWDVARFLWDGPGSPDDLLFALTHVVGHHYDVSWGNSAV